MSYFHAIVLGIVQGLTEFLPVSSSGHLVLFQQFFGLHEEMLTFDVFVHVGTLFAVFVMFRRSILNLLSGSIADLIDMHRNGTGFRAAIAGSPYLGTVTGIIIGTIPAVLVGLLLKDTIEGLFSTTLPVLLALAITGVFLIGTFFAGQGENRIGPWRGLLIGIAQACAIIPGISRSGATISAALFLKSKRDEAGEFSFLLAIPAIGGATLLTAKDVMEAGVASLPWGAYLAGMAAAFVFGWGSLVVLMRVVRRGRIGWFGIYCLTVAVIGFGLHTFKPVEAQTLDRELHMNIETTRIASSFDGAMQPMRYLKAEGRQRPLLVALHTWSNDYTMESQVEYFQRCAERDWNCVFPDFRGQSNHPEAGGSEAALRDILDAVEWAGDNMSVDHRRIFLCGESGGGHMALLSAANSPSTWTAVSAWASISDLERWHAETAERSLKYTAEIEAVCGGKPGESQTIDREYEKRSPIHSLWRAHIIPMDINTGIHDGHTGSVPIGQSIRAFNAIVKAAGKTSDIIPEETIEFMEAEERAPAQYRPEPSFDTDYGREIHLRRTSGLARLTVFEGTHEIIHDAAFAWFDTF